MATRRMTPVETRLVVIYLDNEKQLFKLTDHAEEGAKNDRQNDEPRIPFVAVVDRGNSKEHENDGFR